uniref:septin-4-like n=1 Tax=Pristiophorus japonicus TaxID=55135 RepID=UPI00398E6534
MERDKEYVGFATLPNQVHRKSVKKGFDFTLMVAGESGLGKSTLIDSLFLTDLYKERIIQNADERITKTLEITKHAVDIEERGVRVKLTIVDTPGFGDAVDNSDCWKPIVTYIDQQFEYYFRDESGLNRKNIQDSRVHCLLYFLSPLGHGVRPLDVEFMRAVHEKVNVVPVIAKADTLTPTEVKKTKQKVSRQRQFVREGRVNELLSADFSTEGSDWPPPRETVPGISHAQRDEESFKEPADPLPTGDDRARVDWPPLGASDSFPQREASRVWQGGVSALKGDGPPPRPPFYFTCRPTASSTRQ